MRKVLNSVIVSLLIATSAHAAIPFVPAATDEAQYAMADSPVSDSLKKHTNKERIPSFSDLVDKTVSANTRTPHFLQILNIGDEALLARIHLIRQAKKSVYIQTFIWSDDETGRYIFREILLAAQRGVKVKLLLDQPWSDVDIWNSAHAAIADPNIEIKFYNPIFDEAQSSMLEMIGASVTSFKTLNRRMHNKLFVVDDQIAITGGRNIEDKYFDRDPRYTFKDRDLLIIGPVVNDMVRSFHSYWNFELSMPIASLKDVKKRIKKISSNDLISKFIKAPVHPLFHEIDHKASDSKAIADLLIRPMLAVEGRITFFGDAPGKQESNKDAEISTTSMGIAGIVAEASKSLVIQTPYFIFREEALTLMKNIRKKHPDFHAIAVTNSLASTDNIVVYSLAMKQRKQLVKDLKFQVFEFKPVPGDVLDMIPRYGSLLAANGKSDEVAVADTLPVDISGARIGIHAKSFVVDDRIAWIGSHNFDPRSAEFNTELAVAIWDERVAAALKKNILRDAEPQNSWVVAPRKNVPLVSYFSGVIGSVSRKLPVLDVWPFRYTTNYELLGGKTTVPYMDPRFHDHYQSVGNFPNINLSTKAIQTHLINATVGFAVPLM